MGWHWATGLAALGHDVHVLTHPRGRQAIEHHMATRGSVANLQFHFLDAPFLTAAPGKYKFGSPLAEFLLAGPAWQWLAYKRARTLHAVECFDVVHHITYGSVRQPSFMGKLGIPFLLGPIGGGERAPYRLRTGYSLRGWAWDVARDLQNLAIRHAPLMRHTFKMASVIYVKTGDSARVVPPAYRHKVKIGWEIGLDREAIASIDGIARSKNPQAPLKALFVGRLLHFKGADFAIRAVHNALLRNANVELTIVGRGRDKSRLVELSRSLGIERRITWIDHLPQPELFTLYRRHDLLLFPSLHDSSGNVVLEAMGNGLPVVCMDLGGPGNLVNATSGIVVSTKRASRDLVVSRLAQALSTLENDGMREELAVGAHRYAQNLTWEAVIQNVYRSVPGLAEMPGAFAPVGSRHHRTSCGRPSGPRQCGESRRVTTD